MITPIKLEVPTDLQSFTLEQIIKLDKLADEKLEPNKEIVEVMNIMFGLTDKEVNAISTKQLKHIHATLRKALTTETKFRKSFDLNGKTYAIHPDINSTEFGEYIDMDKYITPVTAGVIDIQNAAKFMSVLYRPVKSGDVKTLYEIEEYKGSQGWEVMLQSPADVYVNSVAFFLILRLQLSEILISYLKAEAPKKIKEVQNVMSITEAGAGLDQLITLHRETSLNGMQLLNSKLRRCLPNWRSIKKGRELQNKKDLTGKH